MGMLICPSCMCDLRMTVDRCPQCKRELREGVVETTAKKITDQD